jgi:aspartate ammonia-lyase
MADRQMRELYTQYIAAKKQCGEDTSRLTFDAVARSVNKQVPEIMTRFNAKSVEFKVVVKDGKASLKAVPKT